MANENIDRANQIKESYFMRAKENPGVYLHLGCGPDVREGFVNIDAFCTGQGQVRGDMRYLQYPEGTVDGIVSIHSLEHIPVRDAIKCLYHWRKLLRPGGWFFLMLPDLEGCLRELTSPYLTPQLALWYRYTVYGYQAQQGTNMQDLDQPLNPGELHLSGWTARILQMDLKGAGYTITNMLHYDGYSTPSILAEAHVE